MGRGHTYPPKVRVQRPKGHYNKRSNFLFVAYPKCHINFVFCSIVSHGYSHTKNIVFAQIFKNICCIYHVTSHLLTHHPTSGRTEAPQFENHNLVESYTNWQSSKQTALPKVTCQILGKLRSGCESNSQWEHKI